MREDVIAERRDLLALLDGDLFYPLRSWPRWVEMAFWKKPMSDEETFKVVLFFIGNGCAPDVIGRWVLLSQHWCSCPRRMEKRARQINFIKENVDRMSAQWFYYDLHFKKVVYLNEL